MAGAGRKKKGRNASAANMSPGPIRLEDIPWAEIITDAQPEIQARQASQSSKRESEIATRGPNIIVPPDQVPQLGEDLGQHSLPLLPVLVLALAMLCLLALGTGVTPDF